jgi:hypothetical protein
MTNVPSLDPSFDLQGPLDVASFPETLSAHVVTPGPRPRLHGYDVEGDLARHYGPTDVLALALTGELPTPEASAALGVALTFLAPLSVAHASVHAATIARLCGTTTGSTIGVAAIGLAEQARVLLEEHAELIDWLATPEGALPERYRATEQADRAGTARLRDALAQTRIDAPALAEGPTRAAALLIVLHACGLKERSQLEAAIVTARLPGAVAEAMQVKVADFNLYATNLPRYQYQDLP